MSTDPDADLRARVRPILEAYEECEGGSVLCCTERAAMLCVAEAVAEALREARRIMRNEHCAIINGLLATAEAQVARLREDEPRGRPGGNGGYLQ